jgi:alkylation response protein AidB-like acyl-CoA dehydrogenase
MNEAKEFVPSEASAESPASAEEFRSSVRRWLEENCPQALRGSGVMYHGGRKESVDPLVLQWFDACYSRGWTVPTWPRAYGGAGLDAEHARILREEMDSIGAPLPLNGQGVTVIGPAILEIGTPEQKLRHLPRIARGEARWCQGFSEPNAGSDLAALTTSARLDGDDYIVNGSKTWTTHGELSDWMFCLVRTDATAPKRNGISVLLLSMDAAGVSTKPIVLISGRSVFCECFFTDVRVAAADLLGRRNEGWTTARRILEHERSSESRPGGIIGSGPGSGSGGDGRTLSMLAREYGAGPDGRMRDPLVRQRIAEVEMEQRALALTQRRADEERARSGKGVPSEETSMFKYLSTELTSRRMETYLNIMGFQGLGWEGDSYTPQELQATRYWLYSKAFTIAGGCSEVQLDIIANRILGLPK